MTSSLTSCFFGADATGALSLQFCLNATTGRFEQVNSSITPVGDAAATAVAATVSSLASDLDATWMIIAGALVFFMQAGFGMLEAGSVSEKNVVNIMFKNLMDATIAAIIFGAWGYGMAYGNADDGPFIGGANFGLVDEGTDAGGGYHAFFFQWTFAATAATIVSGSVAERCKLDAYFIYSIVLTGFVYPIVVHWVWDSEGWLCAWKSDGKPFMGDSFEGPGGSNGMLDFAGCSVVHMVGGFAGLVAAKVIGPRKDRFNGREYAPHNLLMSSLGTLILWFGWYGFNCGSTLMVSGGTSAVAAQVATTTTIAASSGCITATAISRIMYKRYDIGLALNGILAGLVSITAGCPYMNPWGAFAAGIIGTLIYKGSSMLLVKLKIDDPLDACPVHGFCGAWGALAVGIFGTDANAAIVLGRENDCIASGKQFLIQLVGVLVILLWTLATSTALFVAIDKTIGLRVDAETEEAGLDESEHGAKAYSLKTVDPFTTPDKVELI